MKIEYEQNVNMMVNINHIYKMPGGVKKKYTTKITPNNIIENQYIIHQLGTTHNRIEVDILMSIDIKCQMSIHFQVTFRITTIVDSITVELFAVKNNNGHIEMIKVDVNKFDI